MLRLVAIVAVLIVAGMAVTEWRWTRTFAAPYPAVAISHDPAVVAHGEYLVYSAAACAYCHVPREAWPRLDGGATLPLTGHHLFRLPFGDIYSANLTPDQATGIGTRSGGELGRVLRHGVRADGRAAFPLMEIQLTDEDLTAVASYLLAQPAVAHAVPEHRFTRLGKALMSFAIAPAGPSGAVAVTSPRGATVARGAYLANDVSSCVSCHTDRGDDGVLAGPRFGGGQRMDVAADATRVYVTPNLTPDATSSPIGRWSEDQFLQRMHGGEQVPGTPMPWGAYARLRDDDLRAIYRYLRSLPPVVHVTGAAVQPRRP